jgi:hypothetical protein
MLALLLAVELGMMYDDTQSAFTTPSAGMPLWIGMMWFGGFLRSKRQVF